MKKKQETQLVWQVKLLIITMPTLLALIVVLVGVFFFDMCGVETPEKWRELRINMEEQKVREILGPPIERFRRKENESATHCVVAGYTGDFGKAESAIAYEYGKKLLCIYFGQDGRVVTWRILSK